MTCRHGAVGWTARPADEVLIREFGDEATVFDRCDGKTHYLSPVAAAVFKCVAEDPVSFRELVDLLGGALNVAFQDTDLDNVRRVLDQLTHLGLLRCTSSASET